LKLANISSSLQDYGFVPSEISSLAASAQEQWTASFNPRSINSKDFKNLYSLLFPTASCENQVAQAN
jgi:alcohol dehydrogenase class IV